MKALFTIEIFIIRRLARWRLHCRLNFKKKLPFLSLHIFSVLQIYYFFVWLGRLLMRRVEKQLGGPNTQGARAATGAMIVLGGGVAGLSTVWSALENASKTLCQSIAN